MEQAKHMLRGALTDAVKAVPDGGKWTIDMNVTLNNVKRKGKNSELVLNETITFDSNTTPDATLKKAVEGKLTGFYRNFKKTDDTTNILRGIMVYSILDSFYDKAEKPIPEWTKDLLHTTSQKELAEILNKHFVPTVLHQSTNNKFIYLGKQQGGKGKKTRKGRGKKRKATRRH